MVVLFFFVFNAFCQNLKTKTNWLDFIALQKDKILELRKQQRMYNTFCILVHIDLLYYLALNTKLNNNCYRFWKRPKLPLSTDIIILSSV